MKINKRLCYLFLLVKSVVSVLISEAVVCSPTKSYIASAYSDKKWKSIYLFFTCSTGTTTRVPTSCIFEGESYTAGETIGYQQTVSGCYVLACNERRQLEQRQDVDCSTLHAGTSFMKRNGQFFKYQCL